MKKQIFALGSSLILSAFMYVGCTNSVVDSGTAAMTSTSTDPYSVLKVSDTEVADFSELPTISEVLLGSDSTADSSRHDGDHRGPGHGGPGQGGPRPGDTTRPQDSGNGHGWQDRGRGRDFGRLTVVGCGRIFSELKLTASQDSLLRVYLQEFRTCAQGDYETYNAARKQAFDSLAAAVTAIRASVTAGTLSQDSAKAQIQALIDAYRAEIAPLNATLKAAVDACQATFNASFAAILTPDQLTLWNARKI